jgi:uncharacterized protein (TIGR03905 family)
MVYRYKTQGTCSKEMIIELEENIIKSIEIIGGCNGNLKGICALVEGMDADGVIRRCKGIKCGLRQTSCPDQLAIALTQAKAQQSQ